MAAADFLSRYLLTPILILKLILTLKPNLTLTLIPNQTLTLKPIQILTLKPNPKT